MYSLQYCIILYIYQYCITCYIQLCRHIVNDNESYVLYKCYKYMLIIQ